MNKEELRLIQQLKNLGETLTPPKYYLENLLQNIDNDNEVVTKEALPRYSYSMNWKFAPLFLLALALVIGFFAYKNFSGKGANLPGQTSQNAQNAEIPQTVTAQNADSTLKETDVAINQSIDQLDKDLRDVGAVSPEEDPKSL